jgi:hypothetical protein
MAPGLVEITVRCSWCHQWGDKIYFKEKNNTACPVCGIVYDKSSMYAETGWEARIEGGPFYRKK